MHFISLLISRLIHKLRSQASVLVGMAGLFFFSNVLLAYSVETNFWEARKASILRLENMDKHSIIPRGLSVPVATQVQTVFGSSLLEKLLPLLSKDGTVRSVEVPETKSSSKVPIVVLIQDVHGAREAQENMSCLLLSVIKTDPSALVGLEGAKGPLDMSGFRSNDPLVNKEMGLFFFNTGIIQGAELAGFLAASTPRFVGLEEWALYRQNVEAVKTSLHEQSTILALLAEKEGLLNKRKLKFYSPALKNLDGRQAAYDMGTISMGEYLTSLTTHAHRHDVTAFPQIDRFQQAWQLEKSLRMESVERERIKFLAELLQKCDGISFGQIKEAATAIQNGEVTYPYFFRELKAVGAKTKMRWDRYPHFDAYVHYVLEADDIKPYLLLKELIGFERDSFNALARTTDEKNIVKESHVLRLTKKLVGLSLTPAEWENYKNMHPLPLRGARDLNLSSFESFYTLASARNQALSASLLANIDSSTRLAAVVAGGFHSETLAAQLKDRAPIVTITPKLL